MSKRRCFRGAWLLGLCLLASLNLAADGLWLSITNDHGSLMLSWPAWATDGVLEHTSDLQTSFAWTSVSPALYQTDGASFRYTFSSLETSRFYRVRRVSPLVPDLTGYWRLDEGTGQVASDQSTLSTPLGMTNVAWAAGRIGSGSLQFNGQAPNAGGSLAWVSNTNFRVLPPLARPFSVSLWFSPDALPVGSRRMLISHANSTNGWQVELNTPGPGTNLLVLAGADGGTSLSVTGRNLLLPGRWHQLTVTYASNQASLFLDSRLLAQGAGNLLNHEGPLYFGGAPGNLNSFLGRLDELRTYTNALSWDQISLTGQWHFDDNTGTLAADSSVQGHPASVPVPAAWAPGKSGSGIDLSLGPVFIPNNDYTVLPPVGGPFSLSLWVYPRVLPVGRSGLLSCADGTSRGWQLTVDMHESAQAWLEFTSTNLGGTLALRAPLTLTNQTWFKLDLTYNGGIATLYVNGCEVESDSGGIYSAPAPLILGTAPGATNFNGVVDELKIYGRERAAAEIGPVALAMWETAFINSTTNLVLQASGPPGKTLSYSILSTPSPTRGTITSSAGSPIISYSAMGEKGPDAFAYTVSDGEFTSPPATAVVSVVQAHWLAPNGGTVSPLDGSSPEHAWVAGSAPALDAIWRTNNYYDCFFYGPGEYQTTGWKFVERSTANPGCKHIGSGSQGPAATTLKLVNTWDSWMEGIIFATLHHSAFCDGFEVHNMVLDCNAQNNPKYAVGQPVWLRIPLTTTALVDTVTLRWSDVRIPGNGYWRLGRPAEFTLCARTPPGGSFSSCQTFSSTGRVDVVNFGIVTDELQLQLNRRADGVDYYALDELEIPGAAVSFPQAIMPGGGESRLDAQHSILAAVDGDAATSWASGPEAQVQITLPLAPHTAVTQVNLHWNCQTLLGLRRLGPAAQYLIFARNETNGQLDNVSFRRQGRAANGLEIAVFGDGQSTNTIRTDQLVILLVAREDGVNSYSLREVSVRNGSAPAVFRLPTALNTLTLNTNRSVLKAFDGDTNTMWACGSQGSISAIDARGSHLKFTGLKVIGFGCKAGTECFALDVFEPLPGPDNPGPFSNVLVEDCVFMQPATNNSDGLSAVAVAGPESHSLRNAIIRRCTVTGVRSYFAYSHAFGGPLIENCVADDCQAAVYFEPDPSGVSMDSMGPVVVRSNLFQNVTHGINLFIHAGGHFESIVCLDNEMVLTGTGAQGYALSACDVCAPGPSGTITNVTALNNIIRYADWTTRPSNPDGGLLYTDIHHAVFGNNLIALGTGNNLRVRQYPSGLIPDVPTPEDCDHPGLVVPGPSTYPSSLDMLPPGYRRTWFNNRDLAGGLLPVRYWAWGVDRLASQQQWSE